jgi:dTDP-4-dehydrorhamnose reductase
VEGLAALGHTVAFTFCTTDPSLPVGTAHRVDLATCAGLAACLAAAGPLDAIINTAAVSQPGVCERDPDAAAAVNVPITALDALAAAAPEALFVQISTDQVYDGSRAWWREADADACAPVNAYGRTKRAAEAAVRARWPAHCVLRSSIIVGGAPRTLVSRALFLQWLDAALAAGEAELFEDEYRSPVYVADIVRVCAALLARGAPAAAAAPHRTLNLGGPERCVARDRHNAIGTNASADVASRAQAVARRHGRRARGCSRLPARPRAPRAVRERAAACGQPGGHQHGREPDSG